MHEAQIFLQTRECVCSPLSVPRVCTFACVRACAEHTCGLHLPVLLFLSWIFPEIGIKRTRQRLEISRMYVTNETYREGNKLSRVFSTGNETVVRDVDNDLSNKFFILLFSFLPFFFLSTHYMRRSFNFGHPRIWKAADVSFWKKNFFFKPISKAKDCSLPNRIDRISVVSKVKCSCIRRERRGLDVAGVPRAKLVSPGLREAATRRVIAADTPLELETLVNARVARSKKLFGVLSRSD